MDEERVCLERLERLAALGPHPGELRLHGELAHLGVLGAGRTRGVGLVLAALGLEPPGTGVAEVVAEWQWEGLARDADGSVRLRVGLVLERRDPRGRLALRSRWRYPRHEARSPVAAASWPSMAPSLR